GGAQTPAQMACFGEATRMLQGPRSLSNSAAVLGWPEARADWVRTGGLLYGLSVVAGKSGAELGFRPAMTLSTRLIAINRIGKGERIGYNGLWRCPEDMPVGVAAVGYGDGYPRSAAAGTPVIVGEQAVPLIGRVSMDLITLDLRQAAAAKIGDRVVLWGGQLPVETVASQAGTIAYDLTCGMTRRVLFVEDEA
ncbi:MAG: alanine racemase, partial [Xanthomonadaceae bacterium]|nr:alanine racemase [Xanthomonadaceae bacterium]